MKTLFIIRHAKADWTDKSGDDKLRALLSEGIDDATKMGKILAEDELIPDLILSSTATRAEQTVKCFAQELKIPQSKIELNDALYNASSETILLIIQSLPRNLNNVMVVAHNPGISEFAAILTDERGINMGTADIVIVQFDVEDWKDCLPGKGFLYRYIENY